MSSGKRITWGADEQAKLRELWRADLPTREIADYFGCKHDAITCAVIRFDLPRRRVSWRKGLTKKVLAEKIAAIDGAPPAVTLPVPDAPGWPTKQQLMARR